MFRDLYKKKYPGWCPLTGSKGGGGRREKKCWSQKIFKGLNLKKKKKKKKNGFKNSWTEIYEGENFIVKNWEKKFNRKTL